MLPRYAEYSFTLAAGASQALPLTGNFVTCIEASANFSLGIGDEPTTTFREGLSFRVPDGEAFRSLRLENPSGASITVTIGVGRGDLADNRSTIGGTVTTEPTTPWSLDGNTAVIGAGATQAIPANASRRALIIFNARAGASHVFIRDASSQDFLTIEPGESVWLPTTDALTVQNPSAGNVRIYWSEFS